MEATKKPVTDEQLANLWYLTDQTRCDDALLPLSAMKEFARGLAEMANPRGKSPSEHSRGRLASDAMGNGICDTLCVPFVSELYGIWFS